MSTSPNLRLPYLDANQNQKSVTHNAALRMLDALVNLHVASAALTVPPAAPNDGQCWIVASGGTGAWTAKDLNVAAWQDGAWSFYAPNPGTVAYVDALAGALVWNGTAWVSLLGAITALALNTLGVGTAADPANPLSARLNAALFAALPTTASPAGTGDVRVKLSKQGAGNAASLLFQDNFAGRAEIGLVGDDNFHFKVSPDGATFVDAIVVAAAGGGVSFLLPPTAPTPASGDASTRLATTGFVAAAVASGGGAVASVAGRTGAVTLAVADVAGAAPLASPALTGTPTAPNAAAGTNSAQVATTSFVAASFVPYSYASANYATAANATLTGTPTAPTASQNDSSTRLATTGYADRAANAGNLTRRQVADAAATVLASDRVVAVTALTAARILTLPAASAFPPGATLTVVDESGACSAASTITVARASASDAVNGGAAVVIASPYGYLALESNGFNKWTLVDSPSGTVAALNGGALAGFRNRIIDGNFAVNQRAQASGVALAAGAYGHDRWKAGAGGCTYTFTAGTPDTAITITAGSLQQVIETVNVEGGVYCLSWSGSATGRVASTATGASSPTTTAYAAGPIVLPGVNADLAVTVEFGPGTLGLVQVEPGATATPFERRSVTMETMLCQRYYQLNGASIINLYASGNINAAFTFATAMRTTPTVVIVAGTGAIDRPGVALYNVTAVNSVFAPGTGGICVALITNGTSTGLGELLPATIGFSAEL